MSAEGNPPAPTPLLSRPLGAITRLVIGQPVATLALAIAVAALAITYASTRMGFRTSRLDLLNPKSNYNRLWIDYIDEFGDQDDAVVVVEGKSRETVVPVLEEISRTLSRDDRLFHAVLHEVDLSRIRAKGLHYLPRDELLGIQRFLDEVDPILRGDWTGLSVSGMASGLSARLPSVPGAHANKADAKFRRLADGLLLALDERKSYHSPWPAMPHAVATFSELESEYLLANEGRLGIVLLRLADGDDAFARGAEAIDKLRGLIAQTAARHPETQIGLTGLPVMESDEMRASQVSMLRATVLSMIGVACLFVAGFGGVRHPLMTVMALLLAMAWSLGYLTLAVGHLNILSVSFGVILIGLGIDFGIHYVARYLEVRPDVASCEQALHKTSASAGPGIVTGAITTAIAFFTAGFTEFTGVAELGVIAGGGILLCGVAMLVALPAMIYLCDHRRSGRRADAMQGAADSVAPARAEIQPTARAPQDGGESLDDYPRPLNVGALLAGLFKPRRAAWALVGSLILTVGLGSGMVFLRYDHNLLNLQAKGLESVQWERKLLDESDQNVWFALSIAESREELLQRKQEFLKLASVERVEEIASLLPGGHEEKQPLIEGIYRRLAGLPERPPVIPVDSPDALGRLLGRVQDRLASDSGEFQANAIAARTHRRLEQIRDLLRRTPVETCIARLGAYQQQMAGDLLSRLYTLRNIANPEPPRLADLPESLVTRFVGKSDHFLLKIYGRGDIWNMETLSGFVHDVRGVDARATGNPLQAYEASLQMKLSYQQAAIYALLAITVVLIIDLRHIGETLLAVLPLGLGMVQLFGLLGWLGLPLNPANMIVLPLILGIGVDDGVHVVHDFHAQRWRFRLSSSTATAVLLTSLTSMIGIGSLMTANHQGLQSLGRVLTLGVTCCLFTSLITLPALLTLLTRNRQGAAEPSVVPEPHFPAKAPSRTTANQDR